MSGLDLLGLTVGPTIAHPVAPVAPIKIATPTTPKPIVTLPPVLVKAAAAASAAKSAAPAAAVPKAASIAAPAPAAATTGPSPSKVNAANQTIAMVKSLPRRLAPVAANLTARAQKVLAADAAAKAAAAKKAQHRAMGLIGSGLDLLGVAGPEGDAGLDVNVFNAVGNAINMATNVANVLDALSNGGTAADAYAILAKAIHRAMGAASKPIFIQDDYDELMDLIGDVVVGYSLTDTANDGNNLLNQLINVINAYDPGAPDQSIPGQVTAAQPSYSTWASNLSQLAKSAGTSTSATPTSVTTTTATSTSATAPTINSVQDMASGQPYAGNPGDQIIITGTNFTGATSVSFGGLPSPFSVVSSSEIMTSVPQGAQTGMVTVTTPQGTATAPSAFNIMSAASPYGAYGAPGGGYAPSGGGGGGGGFDGGYDDGGGYGAYPEEDYETEAQQASDVMYDPYSGQEYDQEGYDDGGGYEDEDGGEDDGEDEEQEVMDLLGPLLQGYMPLQQQYALAQQQAAAQGAPMDGEMMGLSLLGCDVVGGYDIAASQRQMNTLRQVTVAIARALVKGGMLIANQTIAAAEDASLPGVTSLKKTQGHLQWHQDKLSGLNDPAALYDSSDDCKKWVMQAFIDANSVEEGRQRSAQIWSDMWTEIGQELAKLPKEIVQTVAALPGQAFQAVTGIPSWVFYVGGALGVGLVGFVVWKIVKLATPAVAHVAASRYLP